MTDAEFQLRILESKLLGVRVPQLEQRLVGLEQGLYQLSRRIQAPPAPTVAVTVNFTINGNNGLPLNNFLISYDGSIPGSLPASAVTDAGGHATLVIYGTLMGTDYGGPGPLKLSKLPRWPAADYDLTLGSVPLIAPGTYTVTIDLGATMFLTGFFDTVNYVAVPGFADPMKMTLQAADTLFGITAPVGYPGTGVAWNAGPDASFAYPGCAGFSCIPRATAYMQFLLDMAGPTASVLWYPMTFVNTCPGLGNATFGSPTKIVAFGSTMVTWSETTGFTVVGTSLPSNALTCSASETVTITEI